MPDQKILTRTNNLDGADNDSGRHWSIKLILESLETKPSNNYQIQLIRSLVVSVIALIFDFGSMVFMKEILGIHYLLAAALSFCIGVVVNYSLSVTWVFATRKFKNKHAEFSVFFLITSIGLALNLGIIALVVQLGGIDYRIAKVISTVVVFFWNFVMRKKILYS